MEDAVTYNIVTKNRLCGSRVWTWSGLAAAVLCCAATAKALDSKEISGIDVALNAIEATQIEVTERVEQRPASAWITAGKRAMRVANFEGASVFFSAVVDADSSFVSPTPTTAERLEAKFLAAESLLRIGRKDVGLLYCDGLLRTGGHNFHKEALSAVLKYEDNLSAARVAELQQLYEAQQGTSLPTDLSYALGRAYFNLSAENDARAQPFLQAAQRDETFRLRASYILAAMMLRAGERDDALTQFERIANSSSESLTDYEVVELAQLAVARLYYELGDFSKSVDWYRRVSVASKRLPVALYESAWVHITRAQQLQTDTKLIEDAVERRQRIKASYALAIERLGYLDYLESNPQKQIDNKVLRALLLLREGDEQQASEIFDTIYQRYVSAEKGVARISQDAQKRRQALDELIARLDKRFVKMPVLPTEALQLALANKRVREAAAVYGALRQGEVELQLAVDELARLKQALKLASEESSFRDMARPVSQLNATEGRLLTARVGLLREQRVSVSVPMEVAQATDDALKNLISLNVSEESKLKQTNDMVVELTELDEQLAKIKLALKSRAETVQALDREYNAAGLRGATKERKEEIKARLNALTREQAEFEKLELQLSSRLATERTRIRVTGASSNETVSRLRTLKNAIDHEAALSNPSGEAWMRTSRLQQRVDRVRASIERQMGVHLAALAPVFGMTASALESSQLSLDRLLSDAKESEAAVSMSVLSEVREQVRGASLKGEVGRLDVAWRQKQQETESITRLNAARSAELDVLDEAYEEIAQ